MAHRLEITLSKEQLERLDRAKGIAKRATYVKAALDEKLARDLGTGGFVGEGLPSRDATRDTPGATLIPGFKRVQTLKRS